MSDYLERLVARSFDPPAAIRPRPVSMFESASTGSAPEQDPDEEVATWPEPPRVAARPTRMEAPSREVAVVEVPVPAAPLTPPTAPPRVTEVHHAVASQPLASGLPPAPPPGRARDAAHSPPPVAAPPRQRTWSEPAPAPAAQRTVVESVQREVVVERSAQVDRVPVQPRRERRPPRPVPMATPASRRSEAGEAAAPSQPAARPAPIRPAVTVVESPGKRSRRDVHTQPEPPAAPSIQVTIGRVEVRATVDPAASNRRRPAAATPAVMSLDEYLKRRAGGASS